MQAANGSIEERLLHCASRRVGRRKREEKASARFARNDKLLSPEVQWRTCIMSLKITRQL